LKKAISYNYVPVFLSKTGVTTFVFPELAELGFAGAALLGSIWNAENPVAAMDQALEVDAKTSWKEKLNFPL
jgi:hypothetical protein